MTVAMEAQNEKRPTFVMQRRKFFILTTLAGFYAPGIEELLPNKVAVWILFVWSTLVSSLYLIYQLCFVLACIFANISLPLFFLLLRRAVSLGPFTCKLASHIIPSRRNKLAALYHTWNTVINASFYIDKREAILAKRLKMSRKIYYFGLSVSVGILQAPGIALFFNRHMRGSALVMNTPHDPDVWYHYILVTVQNATFMLSNASGMTFCAMLLFIMTMAATQLQLLRESLKDMFSKVIMDPEGNLFFETESGRVPVTEEMFQEDVVRVRRELGEWVHVHHNTINWIKDMVSFFRFTSSVKVLFLGWYVCLAVFTLPAYVKAGNIVDISYILLYSIGNFTVIFYESRLADELYESSMTLFWDAYDSTWFLYPRDICKSLGIIAVHSNNRPIKVMAFTIVQDNSVTFLAIMETAYKALSFLLQMDI